MAKGKNLNPADAFRKSLRKKELKKNKAERSKARDFALVKKDTSEIEEEIRKLDGAGESSKSDQSRLAELKAELENINKKKQAYVQEHPEQRKLVFRTRRPKNDDSKFEEEIVLPKRNLFNKNGLPRHPERSVYYDPVMNPFGVAPPGMPYRERPLLLGEVDSDEELGEDDDEDVVMPQGPPPGTEEENDSDDDIPMPEGPPPGQGLVETSSIPLPSQFTSYPPALPPTLPPTSVLGVLPFANMLPPLPPTGFPTYQQPSPPQPGFLPPPNTQMLPPPPPPPGFSPSNFPPLPMWNGQPPPPPGFFPRRSQSASSMQDPLSSIPHQTYQAHRAGQPPPSAHPSLPSKPTLSPPGSQTSTLKSPLSSLEVDAATVSAAPQLRDLKKEATAFIPTSLKRKKAGNASTSSSSRVNAAPSLGTGSAEPDEPVLSSSARPDLLSILKDQFGPAPTIAGVSVGTGKAKEKSKKKDDYEKFVEEMGDILG